ncbi:hypothetical protein BgiBS90_009098, partial [Biomphalaria glabrata]
EHAGGAGGLCGSLLPSTLKSTGPHLTVVFKTWGLSHFALTVKGPYGALKQSCLASKLNVRLGLRDKENNRIVCHGPEGNACEWPSLCHGPEGDACEWPSLCHGPEGDACE